MTELVADIERLYELVEIQRQTLIALQREVAELKGKS